MEFSKEDVYENKIPKELIGIYYFVDAHGKIIYIGKSKNIKQRIQQHLKYGRKRLISSFYSLKVKVLHSELEALLLESQEIKKHLPIFNRQLRKVKNSVSLYEGTTPAGYKNYFIDATKPDALLDFYSVRSAQKYLLKISKEFTLCDKVNGLEKTNKSCFQYQLKGCRGACISKETTKEYNHRFEQSLSKIFSFPVNCKLIFKELTNTTFVTIKNNRVTAFGVQKKSDYKIEFPSIDELKIAFRYKKITTPSIMMLN